MVTLVKHEWHQVDSQFALELDLDLLQEIYPDKDEEELQVILDGISDGTYDIEDIVNDALDNDVELEWERQYDDWWTDRKGGYEITYEVGDESSWVDNTPAPPTHKCTKCRWTGGKYETGTLHLRKDGTVIENYYESDEESDSTKDVCPMCDSEVELTPDGIKEEEETKKRMAELDAMFPDEAESTTLPNYPAGVYTLRIWGRTREIGVGKITKAQYEYWSDEEHEDDLADALNENYDYDENDTPKKARFDNPYYEYTDVKSFYGYDAGDTHMTIEDENGNEIYSGSLEDFVSEAHGDNDSLWEASEEDDELYPEHLGKGYFVFWTQGGKGSCIQTTIDTEGEEFDPRKLKYKTWDVQGSAVVHQLEYDGVELGDEGMDSEHDNWRGQWSHFEVVWNKK